MSKYEEFKIGDRVRCTDNTVWDKEVMIIKGFYPSGSAECHHPTMGIGAFSPLELKKIGGVCQEPDRSGRLNVNTNARSAGPRSR